MTVLLFDRLISFGLRRPKLRRLLNAMRTREIAAAWLQHFPLHRRVPGTALRYRVTSLDNLVVAREVFSNGEYDILSQFAGIRSFADLGCNCGYFSLVVAGLSDPDSVIGLAIDAHPDMVGAAKWHLDENGLKRVEAVWGLLGNADDMSGRFFIHVDAAGSSRFARSPRTHVTENPWREIVAPVVTLADEWQRRFGGTPCDLIKVDIEGSEEAFIQSETGFIRTASLLVLESHRWLVDVDALSELIAREGFDLYHVTRSDETVQVALYVNRAGRFASMLPQRQ